MPDVDSNLLKLGRALRQMRENRGLTQVEVARRAGIPRLKVIHVEAGRQGVSITSYARIAAALGGELRVLPVTRPTLDEIGALLADEGLESNSPTSKVPASLVVLRLLHRYCSLALNLEGNRSSFAARLGLLDFGMRCGMPKARIIERTVRLCELTFATLASLDGVARLPGLSELIAKRMRTWFDTFRRLKQA